MSCIITPSDLSGRSLPELFTLQHRLQLLLAHAQPGTANYRETVASLETVRRTIRLRQALAPRF
ncbi:MAG: hypothetical protein U0P47_00035 [Acidimicrobiales bacterium]